jgi:hypothetical protein
MEVFLRAAGLGDAEFFDALTVRADDFAAEVRRACKGIQGVPLAEMFDRAYADPHELLVHEREAYLAHTLSLGAES